jgi:hypothetical protein
MTGASVPEHAHGMPVALPPISPFPSTIHHRVQHCSSSVFVIMYRLFTIIGIGLQHEPETIDLPS